MALLNPYKNTSKTDSLKSNKIVKSTNVTNRLSDTSEPEYSKLGPIKT